MQSGIVNDLNVAPQQTATLQLNYSTDKLCKMKELLLNVSFKLKTASQLLPAGYVVAKNQLVIRSAKSNDMKLVNRVLPNESVETPTVADNDYNYLIIKNSKFNIEFNRHNGFLSLYEVGGLAMLNEGGSLTPNFWRAPTDNDFGAGLQRKYVAWKNPEMKLKSFKYEEKDNMVEVKASYEIPAVSAKLDMTYLISADGAVKVTEKMDADKSANVSDFFRFGMQMQLPESMSMIHYYGRGPMENYVDRNSVSDIGLYNQTVAEQFYSYIRPQETGTKTDIRWWKLTDKGGRGLMFTAEQPFSASALNYSIASLDDGTEKHQRHSELVDQIDYTNFCIDKVQMGLGCINSWGALPMEKYRLHNGDYEFTFIMQPVKTSIEN